MSRYLTHVSPYNPNIVRDFLGNSSKPTALDKEAFSLRRLKSRKLKILAKQNRYNEGPATKTESNKGWFYDKFVAGQTMADKVDKMKKDSEETKGQVNTLFDDSFQYTSWIEVFRVLTERKLPSIVPLEALEMVKSGSAILIDVRESQDFDHLHAEGAFNSPLFRLIQGNDLKSNLRRLGYALITDFAGTERNPDFIEQAVMAVGNDKTKPVIVMCGRGGSLETFVERKGPKAKKYEDPWRVFGLSSRSLKACYELQEAGFTDVYHLKGGFNQWNHEKLPTVFKE